MIVHLNLKVAFKLTPSDYDANVYSSPKPILELDGVNLWE